MLLGSMDNKQIPEYNKRKYASKTVDVKENGLKVP